MLNESQEKYIQTIPEDRKVKIYPYSAKLKSIASYFIQKAHLVDPGLEILFMGASGLEISSQGDIDLYALSQAQDFSKYLPGLIAQFGQPKNKGQTSISWEFKKDGHEVEFYLTDPETQATKEQIKVYKMLRSNPSLLREYQQLKEDFDGLSFRNYQRCKYEFYNRILANSY